MSKASAAKLRSLRDLLLAHELIFIALIVLAVMGGMFGIHLWDKSAKESQRIQSLVQEIQLTRGDLYRQMKELFDAYLLNESSAIAEYEAYTQSIQEHFDNLDKLSVGAQEKKAIADLKENYKLFETKAPAMFQQYQASPNSQSRKALYHDMEASIFSRYETVSKRAEKLLALKQSELRVRLHEAKQTSIVLLAIPIFLAGLLLIFSRTLLKRAIVNPINAMMKATKEISQGNLEHKVPDAGAEELSILSTEINKMAEDLAESRSALIQTEKQAALGLLAPMHHAPLDKIIQSALVPLEQKRKEKNIRIIKQSKPIKQPILTDEHLLEQVLYNLVLNAIEASPANSQIQLDTTLAQDALTITIADQGSGMPFKPEPNSSSPGVSTKRFGTGLGIPFVFKVCEVLNGLITFDANKPHGTIIKLTLPQQG